jgi:predicted acyl esterase
LNQAESTEWNPVLTGTSEQKLAPGQIVPVDIALYPSSTFLAAGESLKLIISSKEIIRFAPFKKNTKDNFGQHVLHSGGEYDSYLLLPEISKQEQKEPLAG